MSGQGVEPEGEKIRKAVRWICQTVESSPGKTRQAIIREAEVRFDLTPLECEFLDAKLGQPDPETGQGNA
ncbi:MAG: hypothetical protein AB1634_15185 [Thermodesulfobacteriota bacterium]